MSESFLDRLTWRYAAKNFDTTRRVSNEDLQKILDTVRFAPSSYGLQPYHVTVVSDPKLKARLQPLAHGQAQVITSSHLLVFSARTNLWRRVAEWARAYRAAGGSSEWSGKLSRLINFVIAPFYFFTLRTKSWSTHQTYLALGFALAAAAELGIDSCPMEGFRPGAFHTALGLPWFIKPVVLLALGYRDSTEKIRPKFRFPVADLFTHLPGKPSKESP